MSLFYESEPDLKDYHLLRYKIAAPALSHFHAALELLVVEEGQIRAEINGARHLLSAGDGCFVDAFCPHSYEVLDKSTRVFIIVGNTVLFSSALSDIGGRPPVRFSLSDRSLLHHAFSLYEGAASDTLRLAVFKGTVMLLLAQIACQNPLSAKADTVTDNTVTELLRYISIHFKEPLTLSALAKQFGYSPQYLSRLFHKYIPMSITEYINLARINYAIPLLEKGESVASVAFAAGFGSLPSFYRAYKAHTGTLPKG